jgi:hypothetical protein
MREGSRRRRCRQGKVARARVPKRAKSGNAEDGGEVLKGGTVVAVSECEGTTLPTNRVLTGRRTSGPARAAPAVPRGEGHEDGADWSARNNPSG